MGIWQPDINRTQDTEFARRDPNWGGPKPGSCLELIGWLLACVLVLAPFFTLLPTRLF